MGNEWKAPEGELNEKDLAAEGVKDGDLKEVSGGGESFFQDGVFFNPKSQDGTLLNPESQDGVFMNPKAPDGTLLNPESPDGTLLNPESPDGAMFSPK